MPSNSMEPPEMRQPSRAKPMAASPMVDFPRPGLPDEAHDLAAAQVEVDAVHDLEPLLVGPALDAQAPNLQQQALFVTHGFTPSDRRRGGASSPPRS